MTGLTVALLLWAMSKLSSPDNSASSSPRVRSPLKKKEQKELKRKIAQVEKANEREATKPAIVTRSAPTRVKQAAMTQPAPWPATTPTHLPPFPGEGWVADSPPPLGVQARAMQLIAPLHAKGVGSHVIEQTGGRWIAYVSRLHGPKRAVEAYRERGEPSVAPRPTQGPVVAKYEPPRGVVAVTRVPVPAVAPVRAAERAPEPVARPTRAVRPTLRFGSAGEHVVDLQTRLGGIQVDGKFGPKTDAAVRGYQRSHGLKADGIVGPLTWASLDGVEA